MNYLSAYLSLSQQLSQPSSLDVAGWISAGGVLLSIVVTLVILGVWGGRLTERQKTLEEQQKTITANMITRDQGANMLERLARIEGMFELKLKE